MAGKVYLVGAGPGDPGLLTLRGRWCLERADVVIYDRLVHPALLALIPPAAERIYAGKEEGGGGTSQAELNQLMVAQARAGRTVVRLKGGDPFVFGRGGEEAEALRAAGIPFEVVPGVTAAVAVPAYAGIPVTHRELARSVAVVTGRTAGEAQPDWGTLARAVDTLVILMGVGRLEEVASQLMAGGRPPDTPVAVIRWGTTAEQQVVEGTLATIASLARQARITPPATVVVGEVVRLRHQLNWFEGRPLAGCRVLVTRAREQSGVLSQRLAELGAEPWEFPAIAIVPPPDYGPLDEALQHLERYHWLALTSANGVRGVLARLWELGRDVRALAGLRIAAVGTATAAALQEAGLRADLVAAEFQAEGLVQALAGVGVRGQRVLLARAAEGREVLPQGLAALGAQVDEVAVYRTVPAATDPAAEAVREALAEGRIGAVTFTSSSTVRYTLEALGDEAARYLVGVVVACIGPVTANEARRRGLRVDVVPPQATVDALARSLAEYWQARRRSPAAEG